MDPIDSLSLCESDQALSLAGRDDCSRISNAMRQQAEHSLYIFDDDPQPDRRAAGRFGGTASFSHPGRAAERIACFNTTRKRTTRNTELQALQPARLF